MSGLICDQFSVPESSTMLRAFALNRGAGAGVEKSVPLTYPNRRKCEGTPTRPTSGVSRTVNSRIEERGRVFARSLREQRYRAGEGAGREDVGVLGEEAEQQTREEDVEPVDALLRVDARHEDL